VDAATSRNGDRSKRVLVRPSRHAPEPVGALRPGLGGGADGTRVGALRPGLGRRDPEPEPDTSAEPEPDTSAEPEPDAAVEVEPDTAPGSEGWLSQAPLIVFGAAAMAAGLAVARATDGGVVVGPAAAAVVRGASYLGLVLSAGSLVFITALWPAGLRLRRVATMVWLGWLTAVLATVLQLVLHADGAGTAAADGERIASALGLRLGALLASVIWVSAALSRRSALRVPGAVLFVTLACTWVYAGPAAPGWLTVVVTVAHISAACMWAGGLAVLAIVLLPRGMTPSLAGALTRFSGVAALCVAVLAVSGVFHGWSRAGSAGHLVSTSYGHTFWLKLAAVVAMLLVANGNRRYVSRQVAAYLIDGSPAATAEGDTAPEAPRASPPLQMLGLFLGAEIAFGVVVMLLTGVLVGAPVSR
jgi:copper transport protein